MTLIMYTTRTISGWVLTGLLGLLFVGSAAAKVLTAGAASHFREWGLGDHLYLIAFGEMVSALLFLVPRSFSLGVLLLSAYMGGAIVTHMQHGESYVAQSVILALIWLTGWLRHPEMFASFRNSRTNRLA